MADIEPGGRQARGPDGRTTGERLSASRTDQGLSPAALSDRTDNHVSASHIRLIETGHGDLEPWAADELATALGRSQMYLIHGIDDQALTPLRIDLQNAMQARARGDHAQACRTYAHILQSEPALELLPDLNNDVLSNYAQALGERGDAQSTQILHSLAHRPQPGNRAWAAIHQQLIQHYRRAGDLNRAIETGQGALAQIADQPGCGNARVSIAIDLLPALVHAGQQHQTHALITNLENRLEVGGDPALLFAAHVAIADTAAQTGDSRRHLHHAGQAHRLAQQHAPSAAQPDYLHRMTTTLAHLLLRTEQPEQARQAQEILSRDRLRWTTQPAAVTTSREVALARAERILGEPHHAFQRLTTVQYTAPMRLPEHNGRILAELGRVHAALGRADTAADHLRRAETPLRTAGLDGEAADARHRADALRPPPTAAPQPGLAALAKLGQAASAAPRTSTETQRHTRKPARPTTAHWPPAWNLPSAER